MPVQSLVCSFVRSFGRAFAQVRLYYARIGVPASFTLTLRRARTFLMERRVFNDHLLWFPGVPSPVPADRIYVWDSSGIGARVLVK